MTVANIIPVVTALDIALLALAMVLVSVTLGAMVTWRLEGRDRRAPPLWLIVMRNFSQIALVAYLVVSGDPPTGVITIEPLWWNVLEGFLVVTTLVVFPLEVRQFLRRRPAT